MGKSVVVTRQNGKGDGITGHKYFEVVLRICAPFSYISFRSHKGFLTGHFSHLQVNPWPC